MAQLDDNIAKAHARLTLVDGLLRALDAGGSLVDAIAACADRISALDMLTQQPWKFTELVAKHILDTPYGRTTALARQDLRDERDELVLIIENAELQA